MNLDYTEFQDLLRQSARDFVAREYPISRHRALIESGQSFDPEAWAKVAGLGWLGLTTSEAHGGTGGSWLDLIVLLEELGRGLFPCAFLAQSLAADIIEEFADDAQRADLLPGLISGRRTFAPAILESRATWDEDGIHARAVESAEGYTLTGTKHFVRGAGAAGTLIVVARVGDGVGWFIIDADTPGVTVTPLRNTGGDDQARVDLEDVPLPVAALLGGSALGWDVISRVVEWGSLIEAAYGVGVIARDTEITIDYVKERVQFGRPIGAFQAVKHQVADQVTDVDCGRLLVLYAAWALDTGAPDAAVAVARAKAWLSDALRRVARTGNQLHGGIGFALEYDIHFYFERAKTSELMFGIADDHRERIAAALLDG